MVVEVGADLPAVLLYRLRVRERTRGPYGLGGFGLDVGDRLNRRPLTRVGTPKERKEVDLLVLACAAVAPVLAGNGA